MAIRLAHEVRAIIDRFDSKILLVQEKEGRDAGRWILPGGLVENDKSPIVAINRLLKNIFPDIHYDGTPFIFYGPAYLDGHKLLTVLIVHLEGKAIHIGNNGIGIAKLLWVKLVEALNGDQEYNMSEMLRQTLIKLQRMRGERPPEILD